MVQSICTWCLWIMEEQMFWHRTAVKSCVVFAVPRARTFAQFIAKHRAMRIVQYMAVRLVRCFRLFFSGNVFLSLPIYRKHPRCAERVTKFAPLIYRSLIFCFVCATKQNVKRSPPRERFPCHPLRRLRPLLRSGARR